MRKNTLVYLSLVGAITVGLSGCMVTHQDLYNVRDSLRTQVAALDEDVRDLKQEDAKVRVASANQVEGMRQEVQSVRNDFDRLQGELSGMKAELETIRSLQADLNADLYAARSHTQERAGEIEKSVHVLQRQMREEYQQDLAKIDRVEQVAEQRIAVLSERLARLEEKMEETEEAIARQAKASAAAPVAPAEPIPAQETPRPEAVQTARVEAAVPDISKLKGPDEIYSTALSFFRKGEYAKARSVFAEFVGLYPTDPMADNSQFWLGETFYREGKFEDAILEYQKVIQRYSTGNKVPDALLKQALSFQKLGDNTSAKILFQKLVKEFSETSQAKIALSELRKMN